MVGVSLKSRLVLVLALCFGLCCSMANAGDIISLYGEENVGTSGAVFLRVPVGARAVAMGKAYVSIATDGSALYWNPACIMQAPGRKNFFAGHTEYAADIGLEYLSFHMRGQNFGYGLSFGTLRSGDILRTDELHQDGTGQYFNANQVFVGLSLSRAMTDRFFIGGTVKYFQENLDEYQLSSVLADMGILYKVGWQSVQIGFSVRNFGTDLKPGGTPPPLADGYIAATDFQEFPAPTVGTFGASNAWQLGRKVVLLTAADFNHPSDARESLRLGGELGLRQMLFLRAGYETSRQEGGFAAGFGVQLKRKQFLLRLDYAFSDMGSFGTVHHISVDLSPLVRRKPQDAWRTGRE